MRQFSFQSRQPRRGQALLLAVLIMIFAALLSASFIAIVSVNLNQTARQVDKNRAAASAKAGVDYINRQLAFSADGENWRPTLPNTNDAGYATYYTPLDRAQGWADNYAKFPDPLSAQGINNGPQFLAKVERIPYNLTSANPEFDKAGSLKVTVIGLSQEDPTAYTRSIFYKGGYQHAPIAQNMRVVSNWDFKNGVVPVAQVATLVDPLTVTLKGIKGDFPEPPFAVMIGDPRSVAPPATPKIRGAVVVEKTATTFKFAHTGVVGAGLAIDPNERIELAASIGAPKGLDYNNSGIPQPIPTSIAVKIADNTAPNTPTSGGIRINGGLWLTGEASSDLLRAPRDAYGPNVAAPATIQASGMFGRELPLDTTEFKVQGQGITNSSNDLASSNGATFPGDWSLPTGYDRSIKDQLVSDGWNRLSGIPSSARTAVGTGATPNSTGTRSVTNFIPPAIDRGENLDRYRNLTRFSPPATGTNASASLHGGGEGIYIDNAQDKERIYATDEDADNDNILDAGEDVNNDGFLETTTGFRDMNQHDLVRMWVSRPLPALPPLPAGVLLPDDYMRTGNPKALNIATASLEQQRVRGWVGPDEFRARGVEIELDDRDYDTVTAGIQPGLIITRDPRSDNTTTLLKALGPDPDKAWKNMTTGATRTGVYRQALPWPKNGVVFAEGNIRIKGSTANAPSSLTVVSMGNIYIEDSLSAAPRKVLLLATKNVVMNPTRVLGRPDAQTTVTTTAPVTPPANAGEPATQTLTVADGLSFQIGDYVQSFVSATGAIGGQGYVVAPAPTDTQINLSSVTGSVSAGEVLRTPNVLPQTVPLVAAVPPPTGRSVSVSAITGVNDVTQRRLALSAAPSADFRLAFDHQGKRVNAFTASVEPTVTPNRTNPTTSDIYFSNKGVLLPGPPTAAPFLDNRASIIPSSDKRLRGQYTQPTAGTDEFPDATVAPTLTTETLAQGQSLIEIRDAMNAKINEGTADGDVGWKYQTSVANANFNAIPFFYLAGVGNRFDNYGTINLEGRKNINVLKDPMPTPPITPYVVPFANTIGLFTNSARSLIFGFNPNYVTAPTEEDILTGDQGFYQSDTGKSTLDSRQLLTPLNSGPNTSNSFHLRQNNLTIPLPVNTTAEPNNYPDYRILGLKTEEVGLSADATTVNTIRPAHTFTVNAFVYAQTGSWFVIPGGLFNDRLKTNAGQTITFLDANDNGTAEADEYIPANTPGRNDNPIGYPDLNRNGIIEDVEENAMARYSRYNYEINFNGAISEGQTPIVNTMKDKAPNATPPINTVANGAVEAWMLSWSTVNKTDAATAPFNGRMTYTFDDDYVTGQLQNDPGFRLPQTTAIFNVS